MKLKFNMHLVTIEDDIYGSQKKPAFTLSENNIPAFNLLKKNNLLFWQKKKKTVSPKITQPPPPPPPPPQKIKWSVP